MGSGIFYSKIANTQKNVKKSGFSRMLFLAGALLLSLPFQSKAQLPAFVNGHKSSFSVCENSATPLPIDSLIEVIDVVGTGDTWYILANTTSGNTLGGTNCIIWQLLSN